MALQLPIVTLALQIVNNFINNMSEDQKRAIDAQLDKLENKFEQGSWEDMGMEMAVSVLRGRWKIPDYPDEVPDERISHPTDPNVNSGVADSPEPVLEPKSEANKETI